MARDPSPSELLSAFAVPGHGRWFTIGAGRARVTLLTQQIRALNLAYALSAEARPARVVVIGGGAAGMTAAAGLARLGASSVLLLERAAALMPLQRGCYKRYLHPHVFDWPAPSAGRERAGLPLLNWEAGPAREVAISLERAFDELNRGLDGRVQVRKSVSNIQLEAPAAGSVAFTLAWGSRDHAQYDAVVFALGFGLETGLFGAGGSYWEDDGLDQQGMYPAGEYVVSGAGDGAMIDLLRILLNDFRQDELGRVVDACVSAEARAELLRLDERVIAMPESQQSRALEDHYKSMDLAALGAELGEKLNRQATIVHFCRSPGPLTLRSRPLHRLLVATLLRYHADQIRCVPNTTFDPKRLVRSARGKLVVKVHGEDRVVNKVVLRHGAEDPYRAFPEVRRVLTGHVAPDQTTARWGDAFGSEARVSWAAGPGARGYLDWLEARLSVVQSFGNSVAADPFLPLSVELLHVRATARSHAAPPARPGPRGADPDRLESARRGEEERRQREEYARRFQPSSGVAVSANDFLPRGPVLLHGRMGAGKSTFLRLVALAALRTLQRGGSSGSTLFPILLERPIADLSERSIVDGPGDVADAIADAAISSAGLSSRSAAMTELRGHLLARDALVLIDTADAWAPQDLGRMVSWLRARGVPAIVAARAFPARALPSGLASCDAFEIVGMAPASREAYLDAHGVARSEPFLRSLDAADFGIEWRTNPLLLLHGASLPDFGPVGRAPGSLLELLEHYADAIAGALPIRALLRHVARRSLCAAPVSYSFPAEELSPQEHQVLTATGLLKGARQMEFSHLSIGEFMAAETIEDPARLRAELARHDGTWHHTLEVLSIGHARSAGMLSEAYQEAIGGGDPGYRRLQLVLRAIAYGGAHVAEFTKEHGASLVATVASVLWAAHCRYGAHERDVLYAYARAKSRLPAGASPPAPLSGEPAAGLWLVNASADGCGGAAVPAVSRWWVVVRQQARALAALPPAAVLDLTEGGGLWDRDEAIAALCDAEAEVEALADVGVQDRFTRLRQLGDTSPHRLSLLAAPEAAERASVVTQCPALWTSDARQQILAHLCREDPSVYVGEAAIKALRRETPVDLRDHLADAIGGDPRSIADHGWRVELFARYRGAEAVEALLATWPAWIDSDARLMLYTPEAVIARLDSPEVSVADVSAVERLRPLGEGALASLRGLVNRLADDPGQALLVAAALRQLPERDEGTRAARTRLLTSTHIDERDETSKYQRDELRAAAIDSFRGDPSAFQILRAFLEGGGLREGLSEVVVSAIGALPEAVDLLKWQVLGGAHNARLVAIDGLGAMGTEDDFLERALAEIGAQPATERVLSSFVRGRIARVLAPRRSTEWSLELLADKHAGVRAAAAAALLDRGAATSELVRCACADGAHEVREVLWPALRDAPAVRALLQTMAKEDQWPLRGMYYLELARRSDRLSELRDFFDALAARLCDARARQDARETERLEKLLAELIVPLSKDPSALDRLRPLIRESAMILRTGAMTVLRHDTAMRGAARSLLASPSWLGDFSLSHESVLLKYFSGDSVAQQIALEELPAAGYRRRLLVGLLGGFVGAEAALRQLLGSDDVNLREAAKVALVDQPDIRAALARQLESTAALERASAAHALADQPEAAAVLAGLRDDSERSIRRLAWQRFLERPPAVSANELAAGIFAEPEAGIRSEALALAPDLGDAYKCFLRDRSAAVRLTAAARMHPAEPWQALRDAPEMIALDERRNEVDAFVRGAGLLAEASEPGLFAAVSAWIAARLVSTLPRDSVLPGAGFTVDPSGQLFGEVRYSPGSTLLRLATDAAQLPRDRNIWPAANLVLAWDVAYRLVPSRPRSLLLVCADVHGDYLCTDELLPGQMAIGPTVFGFALRHATTAVQ